MKKLHKLLTIFLAVIMVLGSFSSAFACTGVYVGSDVTENGSTFMGRSEDIGDRYGKVFSVSQPKQLAEDAVYNDTYGFSMKYSDLEFDYPSTTYSYTYVRDSYLYGETMKDADGNYVGEAYAEAGQNEKGVAMTATVSTNYNRTAKAADKLVRGGICEVSMTSIMLGGAATAREAVEILAELIDKYGAGECNSIMISDAKETWYFEIVSGHQYAAVKMPDDKVSVQPNIMLLGVIDVNDTENVIASENLVKLAEENGFLVTDENGKIDVLKTYGTASGTSKRYWQGLFYFNEEAANKWDPTDNSVKYDYALLNDTTKTLSTIDVLNFLAYRGEGSAWDYSGQPNLGNSNVIGTRSQSECHIFETRAGMPDEMAVLQWQAMADAEFSIYVPYYTALVTETSDLYHTETIPKNIDALAGDTENKINTNFHLINYLCDMNRATDPAVAEEVKAFFEVYQQSLIDQQEDVDVVMKQIYAHSKDAAKTAATAVGKDLAGQVSEVSSAVLAEVRAYFNGDKSKTFALSKATKAMMPVYEIAEEYLPEHDGLMSDIVGHWYECPVCGAVTEVEKHVYVDGVCECGTKDPEVVVGELETKIADLEKSLETVAVDKAVMSQQIAEIQTELENAKELSAEEKSALEAEIAELKAELAKVSEVKELAAPVAVASNIAKTGKIKVSWKSIEGSDEYFVYRSSKADGAFEKVAVTTGKSYTDTSVKAGKVYYYKVKAVTDNKAINNSELSNSVKRTCDLARPVVKVSKNKKTGKVKLSWKRVKNAKKYTIYRATSKNGKYTKIGTTAKLNFVNKNVKKGKTYYYKVKAIAKNTNANSAFSVVVKGKAKL